MFKKILSLFVFCFGAVSFAFAQTGNIEGMVTNAKTGEPLPGANILVKGTSIGTATNANGHYSLEVPSLQDTLVFSFIGYQTQIVPIAGRTTINVALKSKTQTLSQVVVTALGIERKKESLGTSTQTVSAEEIATSPAVGLVNKLAGQTSGLRIISSSGQPGSAPRIVIRGANSITGNNQPLFVINGIPISNASSDNPTSSLYYGSGSSRALDIDPSIIESVTVLKGGAATALYGARAANGVILIETKSGQKGPIRVNFNSSVRFDKAIMKGTQDEYLSGQNGCFANGLPLDKGGYAAPCYPGSDPSTALSWGPHKGEVSQQVLNALGVEKIETYNQLKQFYQIGVYTKNSLNISGGNETTTFFISGSRLHQKGTVPSTSLERTNFNLKVTKQLLSNGDLVSNTSVSYINTNNERVSNGYYSTARSIRLWPINLKMKPYLYDDGTVRSLNAITNSPFWRVNNTGFSTDVNRLILKQGLTYELTPWMSISEVFGLDRYSTEQLVYRNRRKQIVNDGSMVNRKIFNSILNNYIKLKIDEINITPNFAFSANFGNNIKIRKYTSTTVSGSDQVIPGFFDESNFTTVDGGKYLSERHIFSFYGQLVLSYNDYLFLTLTGRNDWSSTLPEDNRSYFYPSVSLAFTFTDLLDLDANSLLSYGKIRASIARTGSDAPLYSLATSYFAPTFGGNIHEVNFGLEFPYNGVSGYIQSSTLGNPNLKPERTESFEVGIDLSFINNRVGLHATYYSSSTSDLIYSTSVPPSTGFSSKLRNAGEIRNRGFSITLEGTPINTSNFNWTLQANWSKNVSEVVSLAPGVNRLYLAGFSFPSIVASVGEGYGAIRGYAYKRNEDGQLIIQDDPSSGNYGYPIVADQQQVIGNIQPDWTGNLSTTFRYKGFSLSALFAFQKGGDVLNFSLNYTIEAGMAEITEIRGTQMTDPNKPGYVKPYIWPGVKASNGEPNDIKVLRNQEFWNKYAVVHENQVEDASYIKLSRISLGYSLPASLLDNTPIRSASFTITGRNLWIRSDFSYGDPQGSVYGAANGGTGYYLFITPSSRSIMFSLSLGF